MVLSEVKVLLANPHGKQQPTSPTAQTEELHQSVVADKQLASKKEQDAQERVDLVLSEIKDLLREPYQSAIPIRLVDPQEEISSIKERRPERKLVPVPA